MLKQMKVIDRVFTEMPEEVGQEFEKSIEGLELRNNSYMELDISTFLEWEGEDFVDTGTNYKIIVDWLIDQGLENDEKFLYLHWW